MWFSNIPLIQHLGVSFQLQIICGVPAKSSQSLFCGWTGFHVNPSVVMPLLYSCFCSLIHDLLKHIYLCIYLAACGLSWGLWDLFTFHQWEHGHREKHLWNVYCVSNTIRHFPCPLNFTTILWSKYCYSNKMSTSLGQWVVVKGSNMCLFEAKHY